MTNLFVDRNVVILFSGQGHPFLLQILCISQENSHTQLVIQKTALDVTAVCDGSSGIKANNVSHPDPQFFRVLCRPNLFVQHYLHGIVLSLGIIVLSVHMDGGIVQLEGSLENTVKPGDDPTIFRLRIVGVHPAKRRNL